MLLLLLLPVVVAAAAQVPQAALQALRTCGTAAHKSTLSRQ